MKCLHMISRDRNHSEGRGSNAFWNLSENSSDLVAWPVPYHCQIVRKTSNYSIDINGTTLNIYSMAIVGFTKPINHFIINNGKLTKNLVLNCLPSFRSNSYVETINCSIEFLTYLAKYEYDGKGFWKVAKWAKCVLIIKGLSGRKCENVLHIKIWRQSPQNGFNS